jgi:hypothetical protein
MALLAVTTLGNAANTLRAEVKADHSWISDSRTYRLVVQSYDAHSGRIPSRKTKPIGSLQRAVTGAQLRRGVHVDLLELRGPNDDPGEVPMVVAWIEKGEPDLEFDGRRARPRPGSVYGLAKRSAEQEYIQISLNRQLAA